MNPKRWNEIDRLLDAALEMEPDKQKAFLDEVCAGKEDLRKEIEELLAADERAVSFIEAPAMLHPEVLESTVSASSPFTLGHYVVLEKLGHGGMGEVYLAEDKRLLRKVALKILPAQFTKDPERLRRFQNEARAASALNHPNILVVYDVGQVGGTPFIATEYVQGKTLRTVMSSGKVKMQHAVEIAIQTASALAAAHEAGIIHRDIKPENILQRPDGYVKVVDFGVAKITQEDGSAEITEIGQVVGTVKYMSSEQVRGLTVDARSDIFSLGVVLYEMLAGVAPFEGKTKSDLIAAILEKNMPPLSYYSPELPHELESIVMKMLEKDREHRYQTARELLNELKTFKHALEITTDPRIIDARTKSSIVHRPEVSFKVLAVIFALILLVIFGLYEFKKKSPKIDSIAVLPLMNVDNKPDLEYLTDGITETMIRKLSTLPNLKVMARATVFRYRRRDIDPKTVGKELGIQAVLTGRLIQHGDELLITIELADARTNSYIWSHQYRGKTSDLLSIQSDIATDISGKLRLASTSEDKKLITKRYTDNAEAYELYLKGRYFWFKRTKDDDEKSIVYFQKALDSDPNYALAWSGLADSYISQAFYHYAAPKDALTEAKAAAKKALAIDPSLAEARITLAQIAVNLDWDWSTSEKYFKEGIALDPKYATGHEWYALHYLIPNGQFEEALTEMKRALELDPLSSVMSTFLGFTLYYAGRYDEAEKQCLKALALQPNFPVAHWHLGMIYEKKSMFEEAIAEHKKAIQFSGGSPRLIAALGHALAVAGKRDEALQVVAELNQISKQGYASPLELSAIYVALGQKEKAFELLQDAYNERSYHLTYLKVRRDFDPIRNDPRFVSLIRRIGLQP
jgi:eukaryotic-like serine/threonine-protein kinase